MGVSKKAARSSPSQRPSSSNSWKTFSNINSHTEIKFRIDEQSRKGDQLLTLMHLPTGVFCRQAWRRWNSASGNKPTYCWYWASNSHCKATHIRSYWWASAQVKVDKPKTLLPGNSSKIGSWRTLAVSMNLVNTSPSMNCHFQFASRYSSVCRNSQWCA